MNLHLDKDNFEGVITFLKLWCFFLNGSKKWIGILINSFFMGLVCFGDSLCGYELEARTSQ